MDKLTSRKFLLSLAAFLGSIGTSITGYAIKDDKVIIFGMICATLSAAIYAACEAMVDSASAGSQVTTRQITEVTTTNTNKSTNTNLQKDLVAEAQMKAGQGNEQGNLGSSD